MKKTSIDLKYNKDIEFIIEQLNSLAYNLWWTWNPEAAMIFKELSPLTWEFSNHSAIAVLKRVSKEEICARLGDPEFYKKVITVLDEFSDYMSNIKTWCSQNYPTLSDKPIAYFSAEFGLHECLPIYSGGLGVLAGDFAKSASDLGLPFYGISLYYRLGYFKQKISDDGWQFEEYPQINNEEVPIQLLVDKKGKPVQTYVTIGHSNVKLHAWKINIGRVNVILLDSNLPENELHFRELTGRVYGGDISTRIMQEIVLGIGGVKILRAMGINPSIFHMNEGHSAFLTLELLREQIEKGLSLNQAEDYVKKHCIFTTHTPVEAGHDRFPKSLIELQLSNYLKELNLSVDDIMKYGRINEKDQNELFCMTVLALKFSKVSNAVSKLHSQVSKEMWKNLYPGVKVNKVPIKHITNGVHIPGWANTRAHEFWNKRLGYDWTEKIMDRSYWIKLINKNIATDEELWAFRNILRRELIEFVRLQYVSSHSYKVAISELDDILSPNVLTIGFARRFAVYKRAPLIFQKLEKLVELVNHPKTPIQIIFSGKAHPRDDEGKRFIQKIINFTKDPRFHGKIVFVENYDMNVARYLVSGADVWLNTPRRPLEASGTSGMKIVIHGGLHLSTLDGWWVEGYNGKNGWAIGSEKYYSNFEEQDLYDAESLINILETQVIPEFYNRDKKGIPRKWIERIRNSMQSLITEYSSHRMVAEYIDKCYKLDR